ncbi:MAG: A/G-specific adenine glycosylase, partial [Chlamydiia bacterium]|nr:A/G-specific adenine glycosylase [Chlamydiia bacterium]
PYAVWVSEVMLQQTQVSVVKPYFERWMEQFPTVEALANAPLEEVIKAWEGLGYYSRARNLHAGAQYLLAEHGGLIPDTANDLSKVKGLGPYTIGAILSFAFRQKAAAVDGNVLRVLARYYGIDEDITKSPTQKKIRTLNEVLLPDFEPWVIMEALIELGATHCQKSARCQRCPLSKSCRAHAEGRSDVLPVRKARQQVTDLFRAVPVITAGSYLLIRQCGEGEIMRDLHEFPYFEMEGHVDLPDVEAWAELNLGLKVSGMDTLAPIQHGFTRFRVKLYPFRMEAATKDLVPGYQWVSVKAISSLAFSSGHRRILQKILS